MAEIRVDPAALKSNAKQIVTVSSAVQKAGDLAWRSASGAPNYDGQFGPKVRALGQAALTRARKHSGSTQTLSDSLVKRAKAFESADAAAVKGLSTSISKSKIDKQGLLKFITLLGINVLLNKAKKLLGLGNLGKNTTDYKIPTGFISESYEADAKYQAFIDELNDFMNTHEGRELAEAAMLAGLLFVMKDDKGNIIAQWGKAGGTQIPIVFGTLELSSAGGVYDPNTKSISINDKYINGEPIWKQVLIHEMQHAVDHRKRESDKEYSSPEDDDAEYQRLKELPVEDVENEYKKGITDALNTEINAFDIGLDYEGGIKSDYLGVFLNRSDGRNTKLEYEYVLYNRNYEEIYEDWLNDELTKIYGEEHNYKADVWIDINGDLQVDIDQTRPWISKLTQEATETLDLLIRPFTKLLN